VAERLLGATRGGDTVARLGGDEFAVLLAGAAADDVAAVAGRVLAALSGTVPVAGRPVAVGTSVGVAHARPGDTAEELLRNADLAMYRAKHGGKGRVAGYEPSMHAAVVERLDLASELAGAASRGELVVRYQPLVDLTTRHVVGVEALARWRHPRHGILAPAAFIPLAEETGAIHGVGRAVLAAACAQTAAWRRAAGGRAVPHLHVNVSSRQLEHDGFAAEVGAVLAETGLPPGDLTLELTEGTLMRRTEDALARLHALKALGVRLAVDDFGTGYSSLAYLQRFPVDVLKLDKSFVDGIAVTPHDAEIARVVLALGDALGLRTVAEGVETPAQYARLRALGCGLGQGHLFAPAVDAAVVEELLWGEDPFPV
jgi:predicted signal transduction protein with EAL and GGDEF domain